MKAYAIRHRVTGKFLATRDDDGCILDVYWVDFSPSIDISSSPPSEEFFEAVVEADVGWRRADEPTLRRRDLQVFEFDMVPPRTKLPIIVAGIGSRQTPAAVCAEMQAIGAWCWDNGVVLRSGHAEGADIAFETGVDGALAEIWLPWKSYNRPTRMPASTYRVTEMTPELWAQVYEYHPAPGNLTQGARLLMARNVQIILGANLRDPVTAVVCWTPDEETGGTSFGIRLARANGIKVINMAKEHNARAEDICAELEALRNSIR